MLTDLGSRNGTFVNGKQIQGEVVLSPGDRVQLGTGGPTFQFELSGQSETKVIIADPGPQATKAVIPPTPPINVLASAPQPVPSVAARRKPALIAGAVLLTLGVLTLAAYGLTRGQGVLSYKVYHQRMIMSAAYKAYGNPEAGGGRYWFSRVVLQNTGSGPVKNIKVSYRIPEYIDWTSPDEAPEMLPKQTVVFIYYPKFPAKITQLNTRTPSVLETRIDYDDQSGHQSHIEKREFEIYGLTEFAYGSMAASEVVSRQDAENNNPLLAAYIMDEDPAVKTFYAKISEVSGGFGTGANNKDILQFIKSVYTYMVSTGMTYSGTKGVPDQTGDVSTFVQSIRVPRDLIYTNTGLCIELAQLWCALGQAAGLKASLVLIPGHAFPYLEAGDGTGYAVEATAIGGSFGGNLGKAATWEEAIKIGKKELEENLRKPTTEILDIRSLQSQGIRPPELPDVNRAELIKMLDDRRAKRATAEPRVVIIKQQGPPRICWWCRR